MFQLILFTNNPIGYSDPFSILCHLFASWTQIRNKRELDALWNFSSGIKCVFMNYVDLHKILLRHSKIEIQFDLMQCA